MPWKRAPVVVPEEGEGGVDDGERGHGSEDVLGSGSRASRTADGIDEGKGRERGPGRLTRTRHAGVAISGGGKSEGVNILGGDEWSRGGMINLGSPARGWHVKLRAWRGLPGSVWAGNGEYGN